MPDQPRAEDALSEAEINALASKSEVYQYHPGAILEFARELLAAYRARRAEPVARHIGESDFETWFASYMPGSAGDKQRARDAYAAGLADLPPIPTERVGLTEGER